MYCNLELVALQNMLPEISKLGAQALAISPEVSNNAKETQEKNALSFDLLHDPENKVARSFGLLFTLPEKLQAIYDSFKIDLSTINGNENFSLPIPASYVIKQDGTIAYAFVDADYTKRSSMEAIVQALQSI